MPEVHMLWAVRKGAPDVPELLVAWDDYTIDGNEPGWQNAQDIEIETLGDQLLCSRVFRINIPDEILIDGLDVLPITLIPDPNRPGALRIQR